MKRRDFFRASAGVAAGSVAVATLTSSAEADSFEPVTVEIRSGIISNVQGSKVTIELDDESVSLFDDGRFGADWSHQIGDLVSIVRLEGQERLVPLIEDENRGAGAVAVVRNKKTAGTRVIAVRAKA